MVVSAAPASGTMSYTAVPLVGLVQREPVPFDLHLRTGNHTYVLYQPAGSPLDESHVGRLIAEGVVQLFIRDADRGAYCARIEGSLDRVLLDRHLSVEQRAGLLHQVATRIAAELLQAPPDRQMVARAQKVMMAAGSLLLRENQGYQAVRRLLAAGQGLAAHSLTVGFLSMGLARVVLGADAAVLSMAGLAGWLHDVGRVGQPEAEHDPEHTTRGADYLRGLGLPQPVVDAARSHHERCDGSGFPEGLQGDRIPDFAKIVGLVNTFEKVYSRREPRVSVFDALCILAQAYRGCFDERMARGLVTLFR